MMSKSKNRIDNKIVSRIYEHRWGRAFTLNHFKDLGSRDTIASALKRHKQSGLIRQLARGLHDYPQIAPDPGPLVPASEDITKSLAGRHATRLQPPGDFAANLLVFSTQVQTKIDYLLIPE